MRNMKYMKEIQLENLMYFMFLMSKLPLPLKSC